MDFASAFTERTPRIVNAVKLHRAANRRKAKQFIIEGENAVDAAVSTGAATDVFVTEKAAERFADIVTAAGTKPRSVEAGTSVSGMPAIIPMKPRAMA